MGRLLHRSIELDPPVAVSASGVHITDATGRSYIDGSSGAAVSSVGHSHPDVLDAIRGQLDSTAYAHTSFFTTEAAEQLADYLVATAPDGIAKAYFLSGGSEAMEAALKLARQYFVEIGQPERRHFIARQMSYHGNTLGALSVGGNAWRRRAFEPILMPSTHVAPCFEYRERRDEETAEQYGARLAREFEEEIERLGPDTVAAFVAETVVGATAGAVPPVPGYFHRIREICNRHGILLILDEVMCGMGRTGTLHACTQEQVAPDIMAIAKGLGGGYVPIGAILIGGKIIDALERGSGSFLHGHTYSGHPLACAAALAVQQVIVRDNLLANVRAQGDHLHSALMARFGDTQSVGDIRGRGLFQAIELVADRDTKNPFDPALKIHARIRSEAMARGLMIYPMGGTVDGRNGDHVLIAPPFIVTSDQIDAIVDRLGNAVDAALASVACGAGPL
jgi:adenosylmethionine-8-amino-7-oxononanoate aminotransferase